MLNFLRFLAALICSATIYSATQAENKIVLTGNDEHYFHMPAFLYIFEDKENTYQAEQVLLLIDDPAFKLNQSADVSFGFTKSAYWIKFSVENATSVQKNLVFSIGYPLIDEVDFIELKGAVLLRTIHTGESKKFSSRDVPHRDFVFDLVLEPHSEYTYLLRVYNNGETLRLPLKLSSYKTFISDDYTDLLLKGFFYGILVFVILFNLFLYITIRDRLYIFYCLYVASLALFLANTDGISYQYFWPDSSWWANHSTITFAAGSNLFMLIFTELFLNTRSLYKPLHYLLIGFKYLSIVLFFSSFFGSPIRLYSVQYANLSSMLGIVLAIVISIVALRKNSLAARYFLASFFLLMAGVSFYVLRNMGLIPSTAFSAYGIKLGLVSEVLLLSFAVSDRFRKIKERAQNELEYLVTERTQQIQQQKEEIETQRDEIEAQRDLATQHRDLILLQKKEITDSLFYARSLQASLLPSREAFHALPGKHFVIYKSRDILGGDFYRTKHTNNWFYVAVADSTGHGIPGGLMSMMGISFLNEFMFEGNEYSPDEFLNEMRAHIISSLHQTGRIGEQRDGMDMAVCRIKLEPEILPDGRKAWELEYAGANNPMFLIRSYNVDEGGIEEFKPDRMPVSYYYKMHPFSLKKAKIFTGDSIYLTTDGIVDQFGGKSGKKLLPSRLKKWLSNTSTLPLSLQKDIIEDYFTLWCSYINPINNKPYEQVDDICMIGLRLEE
jgi:serine phosphatase RsbU (regulator of sigma subunit)